jgi:mono/diheme cytochrome c family protein
MKMSVKHTLYFGAFVLLATSCVKHEDSPGYEYMPDMYRSPAIEAYVDYGLIGDSVSTELQLTQSAKVPPAGTISYKSDLATAIIEMPYMYPNTIDGYEAAGMNLRNPLTFSEENLNQGKEIYTKFCLHCHGEKGAGDGGVITYGNHSRPGAYDGALKDLSVGKMFHTLTYGKGMMGSHASQLTKAERWKVIFYIEALQNGGTHPAMATPAVAEAPATNEESAQAN